MRVNHFAASSVALVAVAAISNSAAAIQADRYSGFECYGYDWGPDPAIQQLYHCPVLNWFPGGLADVDKVYVQMSLPHPPSQYSCGGEPFAKVCVIYASHTGATYGSVCTIGASLWTRTVAGANAIELMGGWLDSWHTTYPSGAGYLLINGGGKNSDGCFNEPAVLRGYRVESDSD
ncbi:hypothetical protein WMF11_36285 [Sorangium sp. So ce295]|uniref:hypothetical protein n=1 Tax=Sorangium sp. So ce295 TaxID=3133295 RepID=UPI003F5F5CBF